MYFEGTAPSEYWIEYKGKHYDAEEPEGVKNCEEAKKIKELITEIQENENEN